MSRATLAAALATPALAGRRVHIVDGRLVTALVLVAWLGPGSLHAAGVLPMPDGTAWLLWAPSSLALLAAIRYVQRRGQRLVQKNTEGLKALLARDYDAAARAFADLLEGVHLRQVAALGLHNLAHVAEMRGSFDEAATLLTAALAFARAGSFQTGSTFDVNHVRGSLAVAQAGAGKLDAAEATLSTLDERTSPVMRVQASSLRALIAYRRGQMDTVYDELDGSLAMRTEVGMAHAVALADAVHGLAAATPGGAYRGRALRGSGLAWTDETRAWVARIVPGGEAYLETR